MINSANRAWFDNFLTYIMAYDLDFAFWPLVGYLENGNGNGWGLLNWDRNNGHRDGLNDGNDWRQERWNDLVQSGYTGSIQNATVWRMLSIDHADYVQSSIMRSKGDWDYYARKAACPDGLRLIGLSHTGSRGLCTDSTYGQDLRSPWQEYTTVTDQSYVSYDWAGTFTKLQCPSDHYAIGYSFKGKNLSGLLCAKASRSLSTNGRTIWFDRSDGRTDGDAGGDFAMGNFKGQCGGNEYIAGVAYTRRWGDGDPAALLCRS